jgi:hypothetical protein
LLRRRRDHFYINSTLLRTMHCWYKNDPSFHSTMYCW